MIPTSTQLREIAALSEGSLESISYPVLLAALARTKRTVVLELVRKPIEKRLFIDAGAPIDCRSNLVHETLGRYLLGVEALTAEDFQTCLGESLSRGVPLGEILLERELLTPPELYRHLQQNLARKLLDGFTWRHGDFRIREDSGKSDSEIRVRVPQLILTGVQKLTPMKEVQEAVAPLLDQRLVVNPHSMVATGKLRLRGTSAKLAEAVDGAPRTIDELATATQMNPEDLSRSIYALGLLEILVPEDQLGKIETQPEESRAADPTAPAANVPSAGAQGDELLLLQSKILEAYLSFRRRDALDFLRLKEEANLEQIEDAYLEAAQTFSPWVLEGVEGQEDLAEKSRALFLVAADAYAELRDAERRGALLYRRKLAREERDKNSKAEFKIETNLLDPEVHFQKGREFLAQENLAKAMESFQFAADCDPQNSIYRCEAAYTRFLFEPHRYKTESLVELTDVVRIDPNCGLASYYAGLLHAEAADFTVAEEMLRRSIKLMAPDRRPIDALKGLGSQKKKRR